MEKANLEKMKLGDLVGQIVYLSIQHHKDLSSLDGRGSPYHSEEELITGIDRRYKAQILPLTEELNRRDRSV